MTIDLDAIRKRAEHAQGSPLKDLDALFSANKVIRQDVPALIAEVERLRAELQERNDHDLIEAIEEAFGGRIEENAKQHADMVRKKLSEREEFKWRNTTAKRK